MRDDGDFAAYLVARWTPVVRTLVMLGCPDRLAEELALSAFARLRGAWGSVRDSDDIDVQAYRVVLHEWRRRTRRGPQVAEASERPTSDPWADLEATLDRLTPEVRATVLLRYVADLSDAQVADVTEAPVADVRDVLATSAVPGEQVFRKASETVDVLARSLVDVRRRALEQRRRTWSLVTRAAVAVVVVVGLATWWATRSTPEPDPGLTVAATELAENPVGVAWFANGELHLDHVVVELPPLREILAINNGAVYADEVGGVVFVADDGARTRLGHKDPRTPLVGSDEEGWVAWSDTAGQAPVLVLYDLTSRQRLRTVTTLDPGSFFSEPLLPVAIDQERLYFRSGSESFVVTPDAVPERLEPGLLDVSSATRVFQSDPESIRMEQSFFSTVTTALGVGAHLSPDGDFVITRTADGSTSYGTVRLYDTRTGAQLPSGLTTEDVAIAAAFGTDETVTYIVARAEDRPDADRFVRRSFSGALELRTCPLGFGSCTTNAKFPSTGSVALLSLA